MRISLVQTELIWEQPAVNRDKLAQLIAPLQGHTDLVILPEMFTTGFTMQAKKFGEKWEDSATVKWMQEQATQLNAAIAGSFIVAEKPEPDFSDTENERNHYNRFVWAYPDGTIKHYDKRHRFSLAGEHEHYVRGYRHEIIDWKGFRVFPQICYDLRFPVWSRNEFDYDLAIYVANWPSARIDAWRTLLKARAIENQCFVVGVNIIGTDGKGIVYPGASSVFNAAGEEICYAHEHEGVFTLSLDKQTLIDFKRKFPFLDDQDIFEIEY
jgi:omega-amidase